MLYLAEVQKQRSGFGLGGGKAELKLLACQRGEHNWAAVPGDDAIPVEEANKFNDGTLVLVELSSNKQVQRIQEAARQLVSILQNFSRLQDKFKDKEEEIEQWKASLTFSSQELNRREMEMQAREEQLAQMEDELERLEAQRSEIENTRDEANRLRDEVDRSRTEMEMAWEQLRGEQQQVAAQQSQAPQGAVVDEQQAIRIQELMNKLGGAISAAQGVREQLNQSFGVVGSQQAILDLHWQQLEQKRANAQQQQEEVDRQNQSLQSRWQEWYQSQDALAQARAELKGNQCTLSAKQEQAQSMSLQVKSVENMYQQISGLASGSGAGATEQLVDVSALEKMPVDELQGLVQHLQQDLEKVFRFVNDQEEELTLQQETIEELQAKIQAASEYDRMALENEMADELESYQMLNETLVGQRLRLQERESVLKQHQGVLWRRLGTANPQKTEPGDIDLGPIVAQLNTQRQQQSQNLQRLETEIQQVQEAISQIEGNVNRQNRENEAKRNELKQLQQNLFNQKGAVAELWGRVNVYQEMLQPVQDNLSGLRQKLEAVGGELDRVQETGQQQDSLVSDLRQALSSFLPGA
ncbi:pilus motility taxis protein HmpF [Microcoleus sp. bin38.metabat.b11b12b14.051]|uniref:pilus motility taxis protein HmpF n=1 Tax=Microcoleus sp. bin38.metabat.b11b12b14.051 TaxID=2742709 RepID=UPI0025D281E9|nr:pilus motility taxis protein HmpF [Microcoleus sp. bin38.metabat.b11b12b14.051]